MSLRKNEESQKTKITEDEISKQKKQIEKDLPKKAEKLLIVTDDEKKLEEVVNSRRLEYKKFADKQKKINYIITAVVAVILIASFICIMAFSQYSWVMYVSIGIMVLVLIGTYISSKAMRKNLMSNAEQYIDYLYQITAKYIYDEKEIKEFEVTPKGKLEDKWFIDAHIYKDIKSTRSRNFVHFKIGDIIYDSADLAGNTLIKGKLSPKFLGRFYSIKASNKTNGKITLFQLKGGTLSVPIDNVDDLKLVDGNKLYCIYSNDNDYKKVFTTKLIKELTKFEIDDSLLDVIVSIKDNLISIGIDYADEFMNIPVDKEFSIKNSKQVKEDFQKVLAVVHTLTYSHKTPEKEIVK